MLNTVELNSILYYADYIKLKEESRTVTDNCKYYFIYGTPMNSACIVGSKPFYDEQDKYYQQALEEYLMIKSKYGIDGIQNYLSQICNLAALGCINAKQMLNCIHQYSNKVDRKEAFKRYDRWINNQVYTHVVTDEKGDPRRIECTRYVAHAEIGTNTQPRVDYISRTTK